MNKRFAAPLAAVLAMSMAFSSLAAVKLDTPVVRWSSEREALPEWTRVENASNEYQVEAFRDGERTYNSRHTFSSTDTREWLKSSGFVNKLKDSGTYTFRVMALGDGNDTLNSDWSELSAPWTFEKSSVSLGSPVNLRWDGTTACWDAPEIPAEYASYFKGYEVYLLADGQSWSGYSNVQNTSQDLAGNMTKEGAKEYSFSVRAVSNTPSKIFHSETVYADDPYKPGGASDKVSGTLDKITSGDIPMDQAPDALKVNIKDVQVAMQSDPDVLAKVEALEQQYIKDQNVTLEQNVTSNEVSIDHSQVKVIGAALNAAAAGSTVSFNIGKPHKDTVVDAMRYKNTIQVDLSLSGAVPELKVPVRITVPIPENVNPEFFHVLHYSNDGTYEDIWPLEIDREARTASFTVTHFSTFVLAEERTEEDKPGTDPELPDSIATPSNAKEFQALADALPNDLAGLPQEERDAAESALWKLAEALDKNDVQKAMAGKSAEPTVKKLSFLFDSLGVGASMDVQCAEPLEGMDYYPLAFAPDHGTITGLRAELSNISTPSNASRTYSFDLELYKTIEGSARSAEGTETKVTSLRTPLKFYISMPDGFEDVANESDTIWYDEETGCIVVYTNDPGRFTVKLRRENSGSGSSGSSGGGSSRSVRVDLMNQSPEGGKWSKDGNIWRFTFKNGILAQSCWLYINNNWYYFGSNGDMATGWFKDNLNNWYYLTPAGAGTEGAMVTGWQQIDGRWYYFNEKSDGFCGTMLSNTTTPDGYTVDGSGAWIQ